MKNYLPILVCYSLSVYTQMDTELDIPFTALSWQLPQGGAMVLCQDQDRRCWLYHIQFRWDSTIEVTDPWLPLYLFSFHIFKLTCIWTQILLILDNAVQSPNAILHFTPRPPPVSPTTLLPRRLITRLYSDKVQPESWHWNKSSNKMTGFA